jgi:ubiquinone/menaquinone biosynthesis C-methylase UbiE
MGGKSSKDSSGGRVQKCTKLVSEPWYVDTVKVAADNPDHLVVTGWCMSAPGMTQSQLQSQFSVNGHSPVKIDYPIDRPGLAEFFWQRIDANKSGFEVTINNNEYENGFIQLTFEDKSLTELERGARSWYLPSPNSQVAIPEADRRFRVIGNEDLEGFLRVGATDACRIKYAYEHISSRRWVDISRVLDWGVGCGRIARHLSPMNPSAFYGCDIDSSNVDWCKRHLPGEFSPSLLSPPLPYPDNYFDAIYGISVFTHLRKNWEQLWLSELRRVLKPGGFALVTVHGETAINFAGLDPDEHAALTAMVNTEGLAVTSPNNQLDGFVEHPEEYVNVFHSKKHIHEVWSKYFSEITILPGYIFTHDLIIVKKQ